MLGGKRVLVTGAAGGMGREIALEAARQGATHIGVTDIAAAGIEETAALVREVGAEALAVVADLRHSAQIQTMVDEIAAWAGGLDVLFNNAGVLDHMFTSGGTGVEDLSEEAWDAVNDINIKAPWLAIKFAAPHLRRSDRGPAIVNAASVSGITGYGMAAYCATKAAVIQLTRTAAINLAPDIRVNCYAPGAIRSPQGDAHLAASDDREATALAMFGTHLIPRRGRVDEVAKVACFLASDDASFITGALLPVDGGTMAWRGQRARSGIEEELAGA